MREQILAQERTHICEDGHIGIIKSVTSEYTSEPGGDEESDNCPDAKGEWRRACQIVEEGFDDECGRNLPAETDERYSGEVHEPEPGAKADEFEHNFPRGQGGDVKVFWVEGGFGHNVLSLPRRVTKVHKGFLRTSFVTLRLLCGFALKPILLPNPFAAIDKTLHSGSLPTLCGCRIRARSRYRG